MGDDNRKTAELAEILKVLRTMDENFRGAMRQSNRPKYPSYAPPFPPANAMSAMGPMMMAWLMSWFYANPQSEPAMLDSMARFAASREDFWHHSTDAFAAMVQRSVGGPANYCEPAISAEDKAKIKAALEAQEISPKLIDCVFHAMNLLDFFQNYRDYRDREPTRRHS